MVVIDRYEEFIEILKTKHEIINDEGNILRNRRVTKSTEKVEKKKIKEESETIETFSFCKSFISECTLINSTIIQLSEKLVKISQKYDQISFSNSGPTNSTGPVEEALNICSMNVSMMKKKLAEESGRIRSSSKGFLLNLFSKIPEENYQIIEHCRLVLSFLETRIGKITENLELIKTRKKNRENLLKSENKDKLSVPSTQKQLSSYHRTHTSQNTKSNIQQDSSVDSGQLSMLQMENSKMIEEMSRGLFETLSTTESQILEISRLQSTLQNHLTIQHDLTCRLFEDSITTFEDTKKGNEYLKKSGKGDSMMRKFLVIIILGMSILLFLLHYFNK